MRKNLKVLVLLVVLLVSATLASVLATYELMQLSGSSPLNPRPHPANSADIELYYAARTVFSTINIVLLIVLIVNYGMIYRKTKSEFTIGLLLFGVFFLVKDVTWSPFIVNFAGFGVFGLGPFAFLPDLFELVALSVLLYLSIEY